MLLLREKCKFRTGKRPVTRIYIACFSMTKCFPSSNFKRLHGLLYSSVRTWHICKRVGLALEWFVLVAPYIYFEGWTFRGGLELTGTFVRLVECLSSVLPFWPSFPSILYNVTIAHILIFQSSFLRPLWLVPRLVCPSRLLPAISLISDLSTICTSQLPIKCI